MGKKSSFTVIDLFSGCGGLSLGFTQAGYKVLLGVDNDEKALLTFEKNHPESKSLNTDLSDGKAIRQIRDMVGRKPVGVVVAGPPCQGFSLTGPRNFDDPRNKLYLAVFKAVQEFVPKAFVIENVPGLGTLYRGAIKREIIHRFEELGYNVTANVLYAADYGIPQARKRIFFVGIKKKYGMFKFPGSTTVEKNYVSCEDAIGDLPSRENDLGQEIDNYSRPPKTAYQKLMRNGGRKLFNHTATNHTDMVRNVISQVPEGGNYKDLPPGVGESRRFNEAWTRYHSKKPSRTIDTGHRNHFHYKYNRVPTVRENARLQSFPDTFVFYGNKTQQFRQAGNAVPPLLGKYLAEQLLKYLKRK